MKLWNTVDGLVVEHEGRYLSVDGSIDDVFTADDPEATVTAMCAEGTAITADVPWAAASVDHPTDAHGVLAPIGNQEIWAAGVTYEVSRQARIEESDGAQDAYERVYDAARPELFFKSTAARAVGPGQPVHVRRDSQWDVPEPELTLAISSGGRVFGYTVGNDVSSRSIEGENPLYLPQAKVYDASAAVGPCIVVTSTPPPGDTMITLTIERGERNVFGGQTNVGRIRRPFDELAQYLYRETTFPAGALLMTGAGVVPDSDFTLQAGDMVTIDIDGIGVLANPVAQRTEHE